MQAAETLPKLCVVRRWRVGPTRSACWFPSLLLARVLLTVHRACEREMPADSTPAQATNVPRRGNGATQLRRTRRAPGTNALSTCSASTSDRTGVNGGIASLRADRPDRQVIHLAWTHHYDHATAFLEIPRTRARGSDPAKRASARTLYSQRAELLPLRRTRGSTAPTRSA